MLRTVITAAIVTLLWGRLAEAKPSGAKKTAPTPAATLELSPEFATPAPKLKKRRSLRVWATYYSTPRVYAKRRGFALLDVNDRPLGPKLSRPDFCRASLEGSVEVVTAGNKIRAFEYVALGKTEVVDCSLYYPKHPLVGRSRFRATNAPVDASGEVPIPFRTIAADPRVLPSGSILYIPAARGTKINLHSGQRIVHDGYFHVADVGGGVKGNHIDVFLGVRGKNPFSFVKSRPNSTVRAYVVHSPARPTRTSRLRRLAENSEASVLGGDG